MDQEILVPLDGSPLAEIALPHALGLARAIGCGLLLLSVVAPPIGPASAVWHKDAHDGQALRERETALASAYLNGVAQRLRPFGVPMRTEVLYGDPPLRIGARARSTCGIRMIAMASHGQGGLGRLVVGSVAEEVLHWSPVPLLLVHGANAVIAPISPAAYRSLLVPLDGSLFAEQALPQAEMLAKAEDALLVLVSVLPGAPPELQGLDDTGLSEGGVVPLWALADREAEIDRMRLYLAGRQAKLREAGLAAQTVLAYGDPAEAILNVAAEHQSDLLVLATHGRTGMQRVWLGSVADELVRHAACPVLLVRVHAPPRAVGSVVEGAQAQVKAADAIVDY